jgi:predicted NAD/FAD-binding protein
MQHPVVIVGAGAAGPSAGDPFIILHLCGFVCHTNKSTRSPWRFAAGLYAAHVLQKEHNIPVELVEAADYVGGRVKQVRSDLLIYALY